MMLDALGIHIPYSTLLSVLDVAPWGTPHRNICMLDEIVPNVHVRYGQGELSDLLQALDAGLPPTVFVWTGELLYWSAAVWHAVVLAGYDQECFFVHDPAFEDAPLRVSRGDLDLAWLAFDSYYAVIEQVQ
jgi:hypothetical protein